MFIKPKQAQQIAPIIQDAEFQGPSLWEVEGLKFADTIGSASTKRKRRGRRRGLKPLEVLLDGLADGPSGFAVHLRDWARHLDNYGVKVYIPEHRACEYPEVAKLKKTKVERPIEILNYPGCSFHPKNPDRYVIGYSVFETLKFPHIFKKNAEDVDELWCASQFCYDRFVEVEIPKEKIRVIPEGVDTTKFHPYVPPLIKQSSTMRFLNICGYSERKGMRTLISAFLKEFDSKEDVELWVFGGWYSEQKAQEEIDELKRGIQKAAFPKILLDWSDRNDEVMPGLFNSFDALALPSKGEGYGRPLAECAACEIPVITTDYAPMNEIITKDTGYLVDVDHLGPEPRADWICDLYKGADFVHPSEESLRAQMRSVYEDYEKAEEKAKRGREYIIQHHNTATNVEKAITRLQEIQDSLIR
ncbi:MAG: glycosyltransferase [Euryarchaeota archaeon]|nr:glycosyltransferase [Euryarchaeota archaeon]